MAEIGNGYGSECHLLRFMGRHRHLLDQRILTIVGGDSIDWLDFDFDPNKTWPDAEIKSLDFLPQGHSVRAAWKGFWPHGGGIQNWDAVGQVRFANAEEWLLVEAKANLEHLIEQVIADVEPTIICTDTGQQIVLLPLDEFNSWQETLYLLSNPFNAEHLRQSIAEAEAGKTTEQELIET